jgi:hypothetical protein
VNDVEERAELVHRVDVACERRSEVEPEAVHVHLEHPVTQAVHDQLERLRLGDVEGVAAAREVDVAGAILLREAVVDRVVEATERKSRAEAVAFARVVVDDVEHDLDPRAVKELHHLLELAHLGRALVRA